MTFARLAVAAAFWSLAMVPGGARADNAGVFTFTVTRDGEPIGEHRVTFRQQGERIEIDEATQLEVRLAMIPLYRFAYQGHEVWENDRPLLIAASTDDNGEQVDIAVRANGHGYVRTVNDRVDKLDPSTEILSLWNQNTVKTTGPRTFASTVEDKMLELSFEYLGRETIMVDGQELATDHYRMMGDEGRDIWYDSEGQVARVTFERSGAEIEYLRNEAHPAPLAGADQSQ